MPILTLQRSYKYIMYATKQPSLRIKQADLKCKTGCGFYGNADWDGYCSKCYRNHMEQVRQKKSRQGHSEQSKTQVPGFSKFEEKKRQQTDKKTKYLKSLPVFRKSSSAKDSGRPEKYYDMRQANPDANKLMTEFISSFGKWGETVRKDFSKCVQSFTTKILSELDAKPIEDLAELAQNCYNLYNDRLKNNAVYQAVTSEVRDELLDFFEKYSMVGLYSFLFCPPSTNDEEKDLTIQDRIRKLSWVNAHHLDCCISETSIEVRDLVYTAINDLLGMDSMKAPPGKAYLRGASVVEVLQHCQGGPVSADEFLPALIFVVLKANPARLKSNILYVTRFCNDSRLMQGEAGYYFTNLCCAVSFIENLTAESLNMPEQEFQAYMSGEVTCVSAWESALVACEGMHQLCEHLALLKGLSERTTVVKESSQKLREDMERLKEEINEKVNSVLERTPLIIKPRKSPLPITKENLLLSTFAPPKVSSDAVQQDEEEAADAPAPPQNYYLQNLSMSQINILDSTKNKLQLNITPCLNVPVKAPAAAPQLTDLLSPSPAHENKSMESLTPDDNSYLGLSKVNYDIDFSDISAENSIAEELTPDKRKSPTPSFTTPDPFSPIGTSCNIMQSPLIPSNAPLSTNAEVQQSTKKEDFVLPFLESMSEATEESLLDKVEEAALIALPSPSIKPFAAEYTGFSKQGSKIPSIPCNTGDFSSLNLQQSSLPSSSKDCSD
ncbi:hypothetical protein NQ315_010749 [Exocentrus adspersus]|uniref:Rab5 GDP/GTP exchange factor n=1 Tax=Exocentrus adspersus TaxID=1586481 RepID=A0AAV8VTZ4_9CUCU|nr:hypothetical protein NQ315_010749 [Exocentrus adspersus]